MSSSSKDSSPNQASPIIVVCSTKTDLREARRILAREYRRIHGKVLPPYVDAIGGDGIGTLAHDLHMGADEPQFPVQVARLVAGRLAVRVQAWQKSPPSRLETEAIAAFCDINPNDRYDQPLPEIALGRVVARYMKIDPLEKVIAPDDLELLHLWHTLADDAPGEATVH